ncbi:MAG: hypothetical protein RhofKO_13880 [Rhodothermales bacterium]
MHLNIKNDNAHRMAKELSLLTGESMTEAVTKAIAKRLDTVRAAQQASQAERVQAILARAAERAVLDETPGDMLLYDEAGLPK